MEYDSMDEDTEPTSGNMIPIALAVLGIVLGAAGLYFGFNVNNRLNLVDTSIQESSTSSAEIEKSVTFFDARIAQLEEQLSDQSNMLNRLRAYSSQSEQAIKQLSSELNKDREQIVKMARQLNEIKAAIAQTNTSSDTSNAELTNVSDSETQAPATTGKERTYTIESGDTFARIAARFGVSVGAIINANPDADPRRLAIGQKIMIPVE
jgi:LysM repeat protein